MKCFEKYEDKSSRDVRNSILCRRRKPSHIMLVKISPLDRREFGHSCLRLESSFFDSSYLLSGWDRL